MGDAIVVGISSRWKLFEEVAGNGGADLRVEESNDLRFLCL